MEKEIFIGLVYNTALLLVLSITYNSIFIPYEKNALWKNILAGFVIGLIGIALMLTPVKITPGVFFDMRSILISVAAMFFGLIPTVIAVVIICVTRIILGGDGALMGVLVTISTFAIGYLWHEFRLNYVVDKGRHIFLEFYIVGVIVHISMLLCMFALPREQIFSVFRHMWFWVLVLYPVGSLLLSLILYKELKNNKTRLALIDSKNEFKALNFENENKQALLKTLIDSVPDLIFYKDCNSVYIGCNAAFGKFLGKNENEIVGHNERELFSKEKAESFMAVDKEIIYNGKTYKGDFISLYPDGTEVRFETLKTSYCDKNGTVLGVIGISRDITDRKKRKKKYYF